MTTTMVDPLEVKIADLPRPAPDDHHRQAEADLAPEEKGAESARAAEKVAENRGGEATEEEIAPDGDDRRPRPGEKEIQLDDMVELKEDVEKTREMIPGKLLVDWPRCSGPHWPLPETDPTEDWARLLSRTRWPMGVR